MDRRQFIGTAGMIAAAAGVTPLLESCKDGKPVNVSGVPQAWSTDVLVIGGGPAGVCAAIAAARGGAKVMIVEEGNCLGGMATRGLVMPFMTCFDGYGEQMVIKGIFEEIIDGMVAIGGAFHPKNIRHSTPWCAWMKEGHDHETPFDDEALKFVLDKMVIQAGIKVLYHTVFVEPVMHKDTIKGAVLMTKAGLKAAEAKFVIDCTGDADVAFRAGVPCSYGNPDRGCVQPTSLFFTMGNVDSKVLEADVYKHLPEFRRENGISYRALHWCVAEAEANGEWYIQRKSVNIMKKPKEGQWSVNCTRIKDINGTDSESLTDGEIEGRRQVWDLMHFFQKYVPGCKDAVLLKSASTLGIRETRRIEGLQTLHEQDLINCVVPEDSILLASNSVDVHGKGGTNRTEYTVINGRWYGVPFGTLVPVGVKNLLVAGRCLSATSDAAGAVRVMPPVMAMGQAAGTAAALCVKHGLTPAALDFADLKKDLLAGGQFLG